MVNQFSSIFEIFTGLNLAYAGSKVFRDALNNTILKISDTITTNHKEKILKIQSEIAVTIAEEYENTMQKKIDTTNRYFTISVEKIKKSEKTNSDFPLGIKYIFLLCSLFSFTLLLLGGYEQFYNDQQSSAFLCFVNLTAILLLCIFIRNLHPSKFDKNISPVITTILFVIPIILYIVYETVLENNIKQYIKFPENKINIFIAIFISMSAFLLHFLRVYIHRTFFRFQLLRIYNKTEIELREFERSINIIKSSNKKSTKLDFNINFITRIKILIKALRKDSH